MGYIKQPHTLWWRRALFQVHLWLGIVIGLYVIAICLSGSVLVFEQNLLNDRPPLSESSVRGPATWGQLANVALRANPGGRLANIDMRSAERRVVPIGVTFNGNTVVVYVDSFTKGIVKQVVLEKEHWFVESMLALHTNLVLGAGGAVAVGIGGVLLFVMAVIGLILWWPGIRSWRRALWISWRSRWKVIAFDLHRTFGFWCFVLVAMWGITGAYFIFPKPVHHAIRSLSPMPSLEQRPSDWHQGDAILPLDDFIGLAQRMYPLDKLAYVFMDVDRPHGEVQVYMSPRPSVPMEQLEDEVVFQPATGAMLMNTSSVHWTAGERLSLALYSVHFGDFGGWWLQIIWALLGLVPIVLVITGYAMWWNRTLKKKWDKLTKRGQ
ncbi:PepSY-associated TM helix domain-containing protein [Dyella mobilis]|uniref:PepSY domain-containing protein n=1 Tax=Dyella mobilis TaxID=1849582 RepID=A0ABS2KCZ8_9GAMM|nr:PepSY-associated TM helix domain-containing protein [Dyella mobilis]MBM7129052.1 PepSY domain-containing protein [Dyella mobilis]GLQ99248.1 hypothetical protein GCM10007863_36680 [Dyella mobilis]